MKVCLDACCLSRLTDDQSQVRIRQEAHAIESVLAGVRSGLVTLISSEALEDEVRRNPSLERRIEAETILSLAIARIEVDSGIALPARALVGLGYAPFDALHLAAAESACVDALLTTDDRLLKRTARNLGNPQVRVANPLSWFESQDL